MDYSKIMVKLPRLKDYHMDMRENNRTMGQFSFAYNKTLFDVMFLTACQPRVLVIGGQGINFFCALPVNDDYAVPSLPDDKFFELRDKLGLGHTDGIGFNSSTFLRTLNANIPDHYSESPVNQYLYRHLTASHRSAVDEDSKIYFCGWQRHDRDGRKVRNYEKTRILTGSTFIANCCVQHGFSSMWTADKNRAKDFSLPFSLDK